jgi:hypothetical protein
MYISLGSITTAYNIQRVCEYFTNYEINYFLNIYAKINLYLLLNGTDWVNAITCTTSEISSYTFQ